MKRLLSGIIVLIMTTTILTACSGAAQPYEAPSASYAGSYANSASPASVPSSDYYVDDISGIDGGNSVPLPLFTPSNEEGKKMVYTVNLWLQTTAFDEGTRKLLNVVEEMGGYVQSAFVRGRSLYESNVDRYADYTFRIPSENLAIFLTTMEDNYNLWQLEQKSQDITDKQQQTDSQLSDLKRQEERLLDALYEVETAEQKLSLERQLADTQASISSLSASKAAMDSAVIYSTVSVKLYEVNLDDTDKVTKDTFGERLGKTANNSLSEFLAFCQNTLLFLIAALPTIIVLVIFTGIILLALYFWRKSEKKIKTAFTGKLEAETEVSEPENSSSDETGACDDTPKQ